MKDLKLRENNMQEISGAGCIIGGILIAVGSFIVPRSKDISDILEMQKEFGAHPEVLQFSAILMVFGFWGLFIGILGIRDSIHGAGEAWARIGFYFNLIGTAIWTAGMSLDISYPSAIVNWMSSPESQKQIAYSVVTVLSPAGFGRGLFPIEVITIWLSYIFISLGMVLDNGRPSWQGIAGLIIGILGVIMGIIMVFTGREKLLLFYIIIMLFVLAWFFVLGVWTMQQEQKSRK